MKTIEIQIAPDGTLTIEGVGFTGKECDAKMKAFEEALGIVKDRKDLPGYHKTVTNTQKVGG